jgi:serine/threonine protein kinase/thioredoxin-like negative regulator of GroEL
MAAVWLARLHGAHGFEKLVAVKTILPEHASDLRFQQMFLDEARLASAIVHVNVGQILDLGEEQDVLFLVMEWIDGDALSKLHRAMERRNQTLPIGVILRIMADVCGGLHAAHELTDSNGQPLGVVHRDVSPHNILVTPQGVGKLIDFGIAKARDRLAGETNAGLIKGKIQYMAPEQALGKALDRRADVFAIGACLYFLLSNRPPYDGENQLATLHVLTSGRPPLPLPNRVPAPVERVVMKALAFKKEDRFATAADLHRALEEAMRAGECWTTTHDVAAFLQKNFAQRLADRKKAIELALDAAGDRAKLEQLLRPQPGNESRSGVLVGGAYLKVLSPGSFSGERRVDDTRSSAKIDAAAIAGADTLLPGADAMLPTLAAQAASATAPTSKASREIDFEQGAGEELELHPHDAPTRAYVFENVKTSSIAEMQAAERAQVPSVTSQITDPTAVRDVPKPARLPRIDEEPESSPLKWVFAAVALLAIAGGALELTSHGAFFRNDVADRMHAAEYAQITEDAEKAARTALAADVADRGVAGLSALESATAKAPRHAPLLAYAAYATFAWEVRFGRDLDRHGKAALLLEKSQGAKEEKLANAMRDLATGEVAKARPALRAIAEAEPKNEDALIAAGEGELAGGATKDAAAFFTRAIAISRSPRARYGLVRALEKDDPAKAKEEAESLAKDAPDHVGARLVLARMALVRAHDPAAADRWLSELGKLGAQASASERGEIACLRGHVHLARGEVAAARKDFDESVAASKGKPSPLSELGLGEVELASEKNAAAITHFNAAYDGDPGLWAAKIGIARAQIAQGNAADAKATLATITDPAAQADVDKWTAVAAGKK